MQKTSVILLSLLLSINIFSQDLSSEIKKLLKQFPSTSDYSIFIYDATEDDTIYAHHVTQPMIPASNTKLFTTAAAFSYLGEEAAVTTRILTDAFFIDNGNIEGNIYIKGFGDPTFSYSQLEKMVKTLADSGLKLVTGDIIGDDSFFDNLYTRDDWILDEKANVNLPPVSALVIDRNELSVKVSAKGKTGTPLSVELRNDFGFTEIINSAKVTSSRKAPRFNLTIDDEEIKLEVTGGLKKRNYPLYYSVYVDNPPLFAAVLLKKTLQKYGIIVNGRVATGVSPIPATELASNSISLVDLIKIINKNSDNFKAECLFKLVGADYSDKQGNSFYATQAILTMIDEMGIYEAGTEVVDGSGISRFNFVTTAAVVDLLKHIYFNESLFEVFKSTLSVSGKDGTLEKRLNHGGLRGKFFGKTGTLRGVTALSGFLQTSSGKDLIVSIIIKYDKKGGRFYKNIEDSIVELVYKL